VYGVLEAMFVALWREAAGVDVPRPWPRLTYDEAMARFGSDKPDTRYGMELVDLTETFRGSGFRAFAAAIADGAMVNAFNAPGGAALSRRELDGLVNEATSRGAKGLVWMSYQGSEISSPVLRFLSEAELAEVAARTGAGDGDLVLIVADRQDRVAVALDGLRRLMAERLDMVPGGRWDFLWITEFPMFEWSDVDGRWVAKHHPFTAPLADSLDPATAKARAYDIVLNGVELGSGSVRIHRPDVQSRVFEILGMGADEAEEKFGHMLRAFGYGVPPHAGFAFGLERVVMFLTGRDNIRDVIAFPKTSSGVEPLTGAPSPPSKDQLDQLAMRFSFPPGVPRGVERSNPSLG
jgi:aspartyl-tRNA synthetase